MCSSHSFQSALLAQAPIFFHPLLHSQHRHHLHIKVQLMSASVAPSWPLRPGCPCGLSQRHPGHSQSIDPHLSFFSSRYPSGVASLGFYFPCIIDIAADTPDAYDLGLSRLSRRIQAQSRLLSFPMATATKSKTVHGQFAYRTRAVW